MEIDEISIVKDLKAGDWSKFDQLYHSYLPRVYGFVYNRVRHKQTAEDITSHVFMKIVENINSFKHNKGLFAAWVFRIARNAIIDHVRKQRPETGLDEAVNVKDSVDFVGTLNQTMTADKILRNMGSLSVQQQEIVIMRVWDDLSHKEIAEILGISEANSKVIFSRAIAALREVAPAIAALAMLMELNIWN